MTTRRRFTFHLPLRAFALVMLGVLTMLAPALGLAQTITVLHNFTGGADGAFPYAGLTMDGAGNFYGTASAGGGVSADGSGLPPVGLRIRMDLDAAAQLRRRTQ